MPRRYLVFLAVAIAIVILAAGALFMITQHPAEAPQVAGGELSRVKVLVVVFDGYNPVEYEAVVTALRGAGASITVAKATPEVKEPKPIPEAVPLDEVFEKAPDEYDAIVLIGGPGVYARVIKPLTEGGVDPYVARAGELAKRFYEKGKLVAAICAAPGILAEAGLLKGLNATCFPDPSGRLQEILTMNGAHLARIDGTTAPVVVSGNVITGRGPDVASDFAGAVVNALAQLKKP